MFNGWSRSGHGCHQRFHGLVYIFSFLLRRRLHHPRPPQPLSGGGERRRGQSAELSCWGSKLWSGDRLTEVAQAQTEGLGRGPWAGSRVRSHHMEPASWKQGGVKRLIWNVEMGIWGRAGGEIWKPGAHDWGRSGTPGVSPGSAETGPGEPKGRVVNARGHTLWGSPCVPPLGSCSELSGAQGPRAAGRAGPG